MNINWPTTISLEAERAAVMMVFLLLIVAVFVKFLFRPDSEERSMQKIIGGLSVFCVALISGSEPVIGLSLFIGGLIIASEKFMRSLAAILKSESADLPETITALSSPEVASATQEELEEKEKEEQVSLSKPSFANTRPMGKNIERQVEEFFRPRFGELYESDVRLENSYGKMVFDAVIKSPSDPATISALVEIKQVANRAGKDLTHYEYLVRRSLERERYLYLNAPLVMVFVVEGLDRLSANRIAQDLEAKHAGVSVVMFSLESGRLQPFRIPTLKFE